MARLFEGRRAGGIAFDVANYLFMALFSFSIIYPFWNMFLISFASQTEVTSLHWDAARARWIVRTDRGDAFAARFVALANGFLQRPKLPAKPGMMSAQRVSMRPRVRMSRYEGMRPPPKNMGMRKKIVIQFLHGRFFLDRA